MLDIVTDGNVSQSAHGLKVARHHFHQETCDWDLFFQPM